MSTQLSDQDVADIKVLLIDKWVRFGSNEDYDNLATLFTDDVVIMPPDHPIVEGKEAAMAWFRAFPSIKKFNSTLVHAEGRDDFACARGIFTLTVEPEPGKHASMKGKWICMCQKQPDGSWLCNLNIFNLDEPSTTG